MKKPKIGKRIEAIKEELKKPIPPPLITKEKEMAKKASKKKAGKKAGKKKVGKKAKANADGGITLSALADEAKISGQAARQKLRGAGIEREEGGRWSWKEGSKALASARKALGL